MDELHPSSRCTCHRRCNNFDEHPWGTFAAPILVEVLGFPGMSQWPREFPPPPPFTLTDEI